MMDIYTPSTSRSNTSILDLQVYLKEKSPSLVLFISTASAERVRARAITKTRLGDATRTMVTVAPLQVPRSVEGGEKKKKCMMPGLGWRSRGQRFFPACRPEKTYVFLRYDHRTHRPSTFSQIS